MPLRQPNSLPLVACTARVGRYQGMPMSHSMSASYANRSPSALKASRSCCGSRCSGFPRSCRRGSVRAIQPPGSENAAGVAVGVPLTWQELVLAPVPRHETRLETLGRLRVVAGDQHDRLPVGRQPESVRPMLAAAADLLSSESTRSYWSSPSVSRRRYNPFPRRPLPET